MPRIVCPSRMIFNKNSTDPGSPLTPGFVWSIQHSTHNLWLTLRNALTLGRITGGETS